MLNLLVDTCVWLDAAKAPEQRPLLGVLTDLINMGEVRLIVPRTVLVEFAEHKNRIIEESGRSLSSVFKRVKTAVEKFGDPAKRRDVMDQLNDVDHRIPLLGGLANESVAQIEALLNAGNIVEVDDSIKARAAQRGIDKVAPFHRQRNGINDAILIEIYAEQVRLGKRERFTFVSHNVKDFSDPNGDNKLPHPDLANIFSKIKSHYSITLADAISRIRPELVTDLMFDHEEWVENARSFSELMAAEAQLCDKVWYNRHKCREEAITSGRIKVVDEGDKTYPANEIVRDIWEGALKSAAKMEAKYGIDNMGPWDDFEWGMINGKLSAIRWVLGQDWDELYT
ncbi:MAG: hypothetical protein C0485_02815 [Pirellula sp.]|nr:hypothetical protein [Pirellula sp.]